MSPAWVPDSGWTGDWKLPSALTLPISESERGMLVAMSCAGMGPKRLATVLSGGTRVGEIAGPVGARWRDALSHLRKLDARALVPSDEEYPALLREISAPPPLLFVRGQRLDALTPAVAIVGSRACTTGARRFAERLGEELAAAGLTIVSGLARGVDGAAHTGALDAGRTVAVLGCGIDVVYPAEHRDLAAKITSSGAIVSEFPPGIGPRNWHFPARNRVISGLCIALIVVEAGLRSGALITAGFALHQGRHVYAATTGPENPAGAGVRAMLKDGAALIVDAEQAVDDLVALARDQGFETSGRRIARVVDETVVPGEAGTVYRAVTDDVSVEDVAAATALPTARVAVLLSELELDGLVTSAAGRWRRIAMAGDRIRSEAQPLG